MGDNIEATRLIFGGCKEAVISEGLAFLRVGFYENLVVIWKYCLFGAPYINCSYCFLYPDHAITPCPTAEHITQLANFSDQF